MSRKRLPKEVAQSIGGGRTLLSVIAKIVTAVVAAGGGLEQVHALDDGKPASAARIIQIAQLIVGKVAEPVVQVAWDAVLAWVIKACRFMSLVHKDITGVNVPYRTGDLDPKEVLIITIDRKMGTKEIQKLLDDQDLRPARLAEILYWWLTNPDKHGDCYVFALGSVWRGWVPYVRGEGNSRLLLLNEIGVDWFPGACFAAVRKSAPTT